MKKLSKIAIVISLILIISISLILMNDKSKKIETSDEFKSLNNNMLSIMLQKNLGGGDYIESTVTSFPQEYYSFNSKLSKCLNGSKLKYNEDTKTVNVETAKTDKCYAYFDKNAIAESYEYTGHYETFNVPIDGEYKIELWGAQGGTASEEYIGGNGAYTTGNINLKKDEILYIYIGEQGSTNFTLYADSITDPYSHATWGWPYYRSSITYNNGTYSQKMTGETFYGNGMSGGGATDIRLYVSEDGLWDNFDSLKSRIMVAGAGSGANDVAYLHNQGVPAGTLKGLEGEIQGSDGNRATGGTQTSGGVKGGGANSVLATDGGFGKAGQSMYIGGSGGSGYYGGGSGPHGGSTAGSGGSGSSFISGYKGCVAIKASSTEENVQPKDNCKDGTTDITCSYHYSGKIFTETQMIAGNEEMPKPDGGTEVGHTGNGYARITLVK